MTDFRQGEVPEGMVPWAGGDSAPADWDGGPVLNRRGHVVYGMHGQSPSRWMHLASIDDIIAYTPSTPVQSAGEATPPAPASVADEASERKRAMAIIAKSWADRGFPDSAEQIAAEDVWVVDAMLAFAARPAGEVERLWEALTPSADTKAAYIGEIKHSYVEWDEFGDERTVTRTVEWTTIKEAMAMILARAALKEGHQP